MPMRPILTHSAFLNIKRPNFLRRTKATSPPDFADPSDTETTSNTTTDTTEVDTTSPSPTTTTITNKFTRRGGSKFKTRTQNEVAKKDAGKSELEIQRRPSLSGGAARSERPVRNFVRRRIGGANATSSASPSASSTTVAPQSRRPFRVASRRRPLTATTSTTTTTTTTTTDATTAALISEESLQDITDIDSLEDPSYTGRAAKTPQPPRRPLVLKDGSVDQNPSATNEDERKRQSKKYSSSFKQNQLDEVLKRGKEDGVTTEGTRTTVDDFSAETALAIAAHQLLAAPIPNIPSYDEDVKPKKSTTQQYKYNTHTEEYTDTKTPYDEYSSTPIYKTTSQDYVQTGSVYTNLPFDSPRTTTFVAPKSSVYPSTFTSKVSRPSGFSTPNLLTSSLSPTVPSSGPSTGRYLSSSEKLIPVPVEDYGYSTGGYSSINNEPSYFTREYLLESPVTKTYDDEYQYLSPVTTPQSPQTTRKLKKTVQKRISTTVPPTLAAYVPQVSSPRPRKVPARAPARKPFEKVPYVKVAKDANRTFRPVDNYDYYDEGDEKFAEKYEDGTKVIVHGKGSIECLDIGNFPHPTSCKKFISCARLENGSLLGWEYVCPKGLSFDPVGGICNWSAGLGCDEKDIA